MSNLRVKGSVVFSSAGNRPAQEDHSLVSDEKRIFVVADGFGGPQPGVEAARTACESVRNFLSREAGDDDATMPFVLRSYFSLAGNVLFNALIHANRKVKRMNKDKGVHERGGASVIAGFMDEDLLALASIGGCTAWLIRGGEARELVSPRTYGRLLDPFASGAAREELQIPLMAIGISEDLEPEIYECRVQPGDWILFHTDGITDDARQALIQMQSNASAQPVSEIRQQALETLSARSYADNATAAVIVF